MLSCYRNSFVNNLFRDDVRYHYCHSFFLNGLLLLSNLTKVVTIIEYYVKFFLVDAASLLAIPGHVS